MELLLLLLRVLRVGVTVKREGVYIEDGNEEGGRRKNVGVEGEVGPATKRVNWGR